MMNDWKDLLKSMANNMEPAEETSSTLTDGDASGETDAPATATRRRGTLHIVTERKGRGGKTATIICEFPEEMSVDEIADLAARLKQRLGTGGSARGGEILIQGERKADVARLLTQEGWKVKGV